MISRKQLFSVVCICMSGLCSAAEQPAPAVATRIMEGYPMHIQRRLDRQLAAAVPAGSREEVQAVFNKLKLWKAGQTLRVCFFGGSPVIRERIARAGLPWTTTANIQFDFGNLENPRECDTTRSDIRIGFDQKGYWSVTGNDSINLLEQWESSMNLEGYSTHPPDEPDFSSTVLHEFGHAIGFRHEHQSPLETCDFLMDKVVEQLRKAPNNWEPAYTRQQMARLNENDVNTVSKFDRDSIMLYTFDAWMYKQGTDSTCFTAGNHSLSAIDRQAALILYPKDTGTSDLVRADRRKRYDALIEERASASQRELARAQADLMTAPTIRPDERLRIRDSILRR